VDLQINNAVTALRAGGIIAYPTEYCFGLGCDPKNIDALARLLTIKQRKKEQGVILVASNIAQISEYAKLEDLPQPDRVQNSWPGPNTWLLPAQDTVSNWVKGKHSSVAMRISNHPVCLAMCDAFGDAVVSTSANRHGQDALTNCDDVRKEFAHELDYIVEASVGKESRPSIIRDALTGEQLR